MLHLRWSGLLLLLCVCAVPSAHADAPTRVPSTEVSASEASSRHDHELPLFSATGHRVGLGVGVETSALWPIFPGNLLQLRAAIPVAWDGRMQLLAGLQGHVPHMRNTEGKFSSLAAHLGVRLYIWKGLHADVMTTLGMGSLRGSVVDGRDYDSFDVEVMGLVGWRFEVGPVYGLVQPLGIASVVYRSNPWAIAGEGRRTTEPPIYVGNIAVGVQF